VVLDTVALVETPEGIALHLRAAGVLPRAAAWGIDFLLRMLFVWISSLVLLMLGQAGVGLYLLVLFGAYWAYPVLFEALRDGQTPGKKALGLRVINANGTPVTWTAAIVRNLLRVVDMLPIGYAFGVVSTLVDTRNRRLGDIVAGTLVVHVESAARHEAAPDVPVVGIPVPLSAAERAAIVAFAERAPRLTPERQQELAALLVPLTGVRGPLAVQRLLGMAGAILGRG
jgi:uncharacterized RDD family membrane protein YckC